jgi:hypothetical protein
MEQKTFVGQQQTLVGSRFSTPTHQLVVLPGAAGARSVVLSAVRVFGTVTARARGEAVRKTKDYTVEILESPNIRFLIVWISGKGNRRATRSLNQLFAMYVWTTQEHRLKQASK